MSNPPVLPANQDNGQIVSPVPIPLFVQYAQRGVTMHTMSGMELDAIASLSNSLHLTFFGLCCGAAIAFTVVLTTISISDPKTYAGYVAALNVSGVLAIYFGIRGIIDYRAARKKLREVKCGQG